MSNHDDNWRPDEKYRAHKYQIAFCTDPACGLHLIAYDGAGQPMAEIVMSPSQTLTLIETCKDHLYDKTVTRKR